MTKYKAYQGKNIEISVSEQLGQAWAFGPDRVQIRIFENVEDFSSSVTSDYYDYLYTKDGFLNAEGRWGHPTLVPIGAVGGTEQSDDEFYWDSFAFLFWDTESETLKSTTTDNWTFVDIGTLDDLVALAT